MGNVERSRLFVRDIEPDPGYEVRVIDPGDEVAIEPGTWEEFVPASQLEGAVVENRVLRAELEAAARVFDALGLRDSATTIRKNLDRLGGR